MHLEGPEPTTVLQCAAANKWQKVYFTSIHNVTHPHAPGLRWLQWPYGNPSPVGANLSAVMDSYYDDLPSIGFSLYPEEDTAPPAAAAVPDPPPQPPSFIPPTVAAQAYPLAEQRNGPNPFAGSTLFAEGGGAVQSPLFASPDAGQSSTSASPFGIHSGGGGAYTAGPATIAAAAAAATQAPVPMSSTPGLTQMALPVTGPPSLESRVRAIESLLAVLQEKIANLEGISAYVRTIEAVHSEVSGLKQTFATWTAGAVTACATTTAAASASASAQLDPYACTEDPSSCAISEQDMFKEFSELQLQDMDAFTEFASATTTHAATTTTTAAASTTTTTPAAVHVHPEVVRVVHMKPTLSARAQGFREQLRSLSDADLKAFRVPEIKDMLSAFGKAYPGSKDAALAVLKTCIVP
jgi:hypothetical protein